MSQFQKTASEILKNYIGPALLGLFCVAQAAITWPALIGFGFGVPLTAVICFLTIFGYLAVYGQTLSKEKYVKGFESRLHYKSTRAFDKAIFDLGIVENLGEKYEISPDSSEFKTIGLVWLSHMFYEKTKSGEFESSQDFKSFVGSIPLNEEKYGSWKSSFLNSREIERAYKSLRAIQINEEDPTLAYALMECKLRIILDDNYDHTRRDYVISKAMANFSEKTDEAEQSLLDANRNKIRSIAEATEHFVDEWKNACGETYNKVRHYVVTHDQKRIAKPNQNWIDNLVDGVGLTNVLVGNSVLGLYGAVIGFLVIASFFPSGTAVGIGLKAFVAVLGFFAASYAAYVMTWPYLRKCSSQIKRWAMKFDFQDMSWGQIIMSPFSSIRKFLTTFCWTVVMIAAINFNIFAAWTLPTNLAQLFSGSMLGAFFSNFPMSLRVLCVITQAITGLFCAGAIYLICCFNQYIGKADKKSLNTTLVFDKIKQALSNLSSKQAMLLTMVLSVSILCTVGQVCIWLAALSFPVQMILLVPGALIYFAFFCEALLSFVSDNPQNIPQVKSEVDPKSALELGDFGPENSITIAGVVSFLPGASDLVPNRSFSS